MEGFAWEFEVSTEDADFEGTHAAQFNSIPGIIVTAKHCGQTKIQNFNQNFHTSTEDTTRCLQLQTFKTALPNFQSFAQRNDFPEECAAALMYRADPLNGAHTSEVMFAMKGVCRQIFIISTKYKRLTACLLVFFIVVISVVARKWIIIIIWAKYLMFPLFE